MTHRSLVQNIALTVCIFTLSWPYCAPADNIVVQRRPLPQADAGTGRTVSKPLPPDEPDSGDLLSHQLYKDRLRRAGFALDEMQLKLEEFGSITMSSLILARPNPSFAFELHLSATTLYENAKKGSEGAAAAQLSIATITGLGASAQVDLDRLALAKIQLRNFEVADRAFVEQQRLNRSLDKTEDTRIQRRFELDRKIAGRMQDDAEREYALEQQRITLAESKDKLERDQALAAATTPAEKAAAQDTYNQARAVTTQQRTTAKATHDAKMEEAEKAVLDAGQKRDDDRRKINPIDTAPSRPINEGTGNVPSAVADSVSPKPSELIAQLTSLSGASGLLPSGTTLRLPDRVAIQQAAGDSATQSLLNFLGNPGESAQFEDKILLFGVTTVGVNPGWRTKKDFAATLTTRSSFEYQPARPEVAYYVAHSTQFPSAVRAVANAQLTAPFRDPSVGTATSGVPRSYVEPAKSPLAPLVAGISPMSDSQTLDLQDDFRRQDALALQLALALRKQGAEGQAKIFSQFAREQKKQVATRSSGGVVNTFSALGGLFGFQVGPRLKALKDPASRTGGSANVLDRQSFPALLFFGIDRADLRPRIRITEEIVGTDKNGQPKETRTRYVLVEPVVQLIATNRWQPLKHGTFAFENWYNPFNWHKPRFSEIERMEMQIENKDAENGLKALKRMKGVVGADGSYDGLVEITNERQFALKALVNGAVATHRLPLELLIPAEEGSDGPVLPQVALAVPDKLPINTTTNGDVEAGFTTKVVLTGANLDRIKGVTVVVGQDSAAITQVTNRGDGALELELKISKVEGPLMFRLFLDPKSTNLGTEAQPLSLLSPPVFLLARKATAAAEVADDFRPRTSATKEATAGAAKKEPAKEEGDKETGMLRDLPELERVSPLFPTPPPAPVPAPTRSAGSRTAGSTQRGPVLPKLAFDLQDVDLPMPK